MKKGISALVALVMCLCFGAWYSPEAYDAYEAMNEAMQDVKSVEMNYKGAVTISMAGQTETALFDASIQQVILGETDVQMAMTMNMYLPNEDPIPMTIYFKDGVIYQEMMGIKVATPMDLEQAVNEMGVSNVDFDKDAIQSTSVKEVALGKELSFELNPEMVNKMLEGMAGTMGDEFGMLTVEEISCVIVINDDNMMEEYSVLMKASVGAFVSFEYEIEGVVTGIDTIDAISFPADLSSYTNIDDAIAALAA